MAAPMLDATDEAPLPAGIVAGPGRPARAVPAAVAAPPAVAPAMATTPVGKVLPDAGSQAEDPRLLEIGRAHV